MCSFVLLFSCSKDKEVVANEQEEFSCDISNVLAKDNRVIGIDLLDLSETGTFDDNIDFGKQLGIDFIALHLPWTSLETTPNLFSDPDSALELLSQAAANKNFKFSLTLRPIDLVGKTVPSDLESSRFNAPQVIARFEALIDFVFTKVDPSVLLNLQIGNEIDGYDTSTEPVTFWGDYGVFLKEVTNYIHSNYPNLKVGFTTTSSGLMQQADLFNKLLQNVDHLGVTYYPLAANYDVKDPDVVFDDLNALVTAFPNTPIYLQEVGYQTSSQNNSSETKQAEFYCNFFSAWDIHKDNIISANIVRLHNYSQATAIEGARPYGISDNTFIEYLKTLGIRNYDANGADKQAFAVIQNNLQARGW